MRDPKYRWAEDQSPAGLPTELLFLLIATAGGIALLYGVCTFVRWLVRLVHT